MRPCDISDVVTWLVAVLVVSLIVFVPPVVGNADSGDFVKVTRPFSFDAAAPYDDDRWFKYIFVGYRFDPTFHWYGELPSSEMLLVPVALALNRLIASPGSFDLRAMGAVHAALALAALALLLPLFRGAGRGRQGALSAAAVLVFFDMAYVCYFNTFYMDAAALLFLWLAAVFYLRLACLEKPGVVDRAGFLVSSLLFVTAKSQHSFAGLLLAALIAFRPKLLSPGSPGLARFAIAPLIAAIAVYWMRLPPPEYSAIARYNAIFYQILPHSSDPARDLRELGLDESYRQNIGTHSYTSGAHMNDPEFVRQFNARTSYVRLAWFYLRHPSHAVYMAGEALVGAAFQRGFNGNYPKEAGKPPYAQSYSFAFWSTLKHRTFRWHPWLYGLYCLAVSVLPVVLLAMRQSALLAGAFTLSLTTIAMFLIGALADGADYARHLYLFNAGVDILAFSLAAIGLQHRRSRGSGDRFVEKAAREQG